MKNILQPKNWEIGRNVIREQVYEFQGEHPDTR